MEDGEDKISAPFCDLYERAVVHLVEFIIYEIKITKEYLFFFYCMPASGIGQLHEWFSV